MSWNIALFFSNPGQLGTSLIDLDSRLTRQQHTWMDDFHRLSWRKMDQFSGKNFNSVV